MTTPANAEPADCSLSAFATCYRSLQLANMGGTLHYYASMDPESQARLAPTHAVIALHGHPRDANKTFDATLLAMRMAHATDNTLIVSPLFQVPESRAARCSTPGVPTPTGDDVLWTCASWLAGERATNGSRVTSFGAIDALVIELERQWPSLRTITIAGFSAGAQMVQHYIGFARTETTGAVVVRYVVADPGTWLYFDPVRPLPADDDACPTFNRWKYGTDALPAHLQRSAADARQRYASADIRYLEGQLDGDGAKGTAYRVLDNSCAAAAQGRYRLQRGLSYAAYDRALLAPTLGREVAVVPGCAHNVACVFTSEAGRDALFGR